MTRRSEKRFRITNIRLRPIDEKVVIVIQYVLFLVTCALFPILRTFQQTEINVHCKLCGL